MSKPDFACLPDKGIWRPNFLRIFQDGRHIQYELFVSVIFSKHIIDISVKSREIILGIKISVFGNKKKLLDLFRDRKKNQ